MDKLFENAAAIIKESGKSALGFGSLIVLSVATVGVLMFKDAKDEHIKLYAFFALLGAFLLCLFTLARSTKKVVGREEQLGGPRPPGIAFEVSGAAVPQYAPVRRSASTGCLIALLIFGLGGIALIVFAVGLNLLELGQNQGPLSGLTGGAQQNAGSYSGQSISGFISVDDAMRLSNSGQVTISVYSVNPGYGYGYDTLYPNEIIRAESSSDSMGNPVTLVTVDADIVRNRAMNE